MQTRSRITTQTTRRSVKKLFFTNLYKKSIESDWRIEFSNSVYWFVNRNMNKKKKNEFHTFLLRQFCKFQRSLYICKCADEEHFLNRFTNFHLNNHFVLFFVQNISYHHYNQYVNIFLINRISRYKKT